MIKNWLSFNESYDQSSLEFTKSESEAFDCYIKNDLKPWLSLNLKHEFEGLILKFFKIFNEEFDVSLGLADCSFFNLIIEPLNGQKEPASRELTSMSYDSNSRKLNSYIWELLKYKNYKPAFVVKIEIPKDEELKQHRWIKYYNKVLDTLNDIEETSIQCDIGKETNRHIHMYIFLRFEDFEFVDPFKKENVIEFIQSNPEHLNALYKWADKDEIFDFLIDNPEIQKNLKGQNLLDFTKKLKSINNPQRRQMEEENQMYIFISRPDFKEKEDGNYVKDIEIENLVPIDPYNSKDAHILSMMKLRARMQGGKSEVYCIWLPKDFDQVELQNINDESMTYLRKLIDEKKERV